MSDPRQPIYNALNWLAGCIPSGRPEDNDMLLEAYEKLHAHVDAEARQVFLDVLQRLRFRNHQLEQIVACWSRSSQQLTAACNIIKDQTSAAQSAEGE